MSSNESPQISQDARQTLKEELEDAVGSEAVEDTDLDIDRAISERPNTVRAAFAESKLLIVVIGATVLTVAVIAALATESWWLLGVALVVHGLLTAVVVSITMAMSSEVEKPDPNAVAKLQEEGVDDPEPVLNNLVEQVADQDEGSRGSRTVKEDAGETRPAEEDPKESASRQQAASTPASEPTRTVGSD
jgi:hypothetical protein